jgi:hypothetical protein
MKTGFALGILLAMSVQTVMANDIEKVMNKALGSGKGQLFKQAGGIGSKLLHSGAATPAATGAIPATPAKPASPAATATATNATPVTATPAVAATAASPAAAGANPAADKPNLKHKLMHRAAVESEKYAKKYGDKYLKQGKGQLGKFLN